MDILNIIQTRRSIRKFQEKAIESSLIETILEAGRWAPSGRNNQPWRFAVIKDRTLIEDCSRLTKYSKIVKGAKVLIAVFLDNTSSYHRVKDAQGIGACIQNMLLAIHSLGLGAVWLGEILKSNEEIKKLLGLDEHFELMAVLAIGYPAEKPKGPGRKDITELVIFES